MSKKCPMTVSRLFLQLLVDLEGDAPFILYTNYNNWLCFSVRRSTCNIGRNSSFFSALQILLFERSTCFITLPVEMYAGGRQASEEFLFFINYVPFSLPKTFYVALARSWEKKNPTFLSTVLT